MVVVGLLIVVHVRRLLRLFHLRLLLQQEAFQEELQESQPRV
jgi:hypothetical protein